MIEEIQYLKGALSHFRILLSILLIILNNLQVTLRLVLLAGTNFSVLVVCCWQVFILAFLR